MDQPRRSRSVGCCKVLLIRYRVVFLLCFLLLVQYWRRQRADIFNTSTGIDEVGAPIIDVAQQQGFIDVDAAKRSLEVGAQFETNMKLVVQDTSGMNEEMKRDVRYDINCPSICNSTSIEGINESKKVFLLIYIISSSDRLARRNRIRNTWGKVTLYSNMVIRSVFIISNMLDPDDKKNALLRDALKFEAGTYGDIIHEDHTTFRRLKKTGSRAVDLRSWADLLALRWVSDFCSDAQFVIRTEDDVFINIYTLANHLVQLYSTRLNSRLLMCDVYERNTTSKVKEKQQIYVTVRPGDGSLVVGNMLRFCSQVSYILSRDVAAALLEASYYATEPSPATDEYYITNLLPRLLGPQPFTLTSMSPAYCSAREMHAYLHETEWYKYAFTQVELQSTINVLRIWRGLSYRAKTGLILQSTRLVPGVLAEKYIARKRLLVF